MFFTAVYAGRKTAEDNCGGAGILPMINTTGLALLLLYASYTCAGPPASVDLVMIYTG